MINRVTLIGNLGNDPEIKELSSGSKLARLSLATNESYKDSNGEWQTQTEWHNVILWRAAAERAERDLKKGMQLFIEGKIKYRKWQDDQGNDRYTTDIEARGFRIMGKKESSDGNSRLYPSQEPAQVASNNPNPGQATPPNAESPTVDDDLPF